MQLPLEILVLLSSVGALQSLFFAIYLFTLSNGNRAANRMLAWLLLALTGRVAKSVGYYFTSDNLPTMLENLGFGANTAITPLLYLYFLAFLNPQYKFRGKYLLHLIPFFAIVLFDPLIKDTFWLKWGGYHLVLHHMFVYWVLAGYVLYIYLIKGQKQSEGVISKAARSWVLILWVGIGLIWAAYASNFFLQWVPYITAPVIFSLLMYVVGFIGLKRNQIFFEKSIIQPSKETKTKYKHSSLGDQEANQYLEKLKGLMQNEKPYQSPDLTLPKLAKSLQMPAYLLSQLINEKLNQNFSDFVNSYRIQQAQQMLTDPEGQKQKIASIAYDCGFNTLSAFNLAFKKQTQMTPSQYRKQHLAVK
ncbi:hypothetical protein BKI52_38065 [marine bacterium AO1-C]|nr:hypothetical protein BKI52_38065 [marine bacterium AO1-C]